MKIALKIFNYLLLFAGILILLNFVFSFYYKKSAVNAYIVTSGSMEPAIKTGSIVLSVPSKSYYNGDVITYKEGKKLVTHRVEARIYDNNDLNNPLFLTSGDANKDFDRIKLTSDQIVGKVFFSVPYLGYAADFAKTPQGFILFVIIPATIIIYEEIKFLFVRAKSTFTEKLKKQTVSQLNYSTEKDSKKAAAIIPIFGAVIVFAGLTGSYFSDTETSSNNVFQAGEWVTPSPSPVPITDHVVISEIQISGENPNLNDDEFVELYNPTSSPVTMTGWKLTRKNSAGTQENLVLSLNGTIPAYGYFLIVDADGYNGSVPGDVNYSAPSNELKPNYTVLIYSDAGITLVDKVGYGVPPDAEGTGFGSSPSAGSSIERKAYSTSTQATMEGGADSTKGNGFDSGDNATDFILRLVSDPQNSSSTIETP